MRVHKAIKATCLVVDENALDNACEWHDSRLGRSPFCPFCFLVKSSDIRECASV